MAISGSPPISFSTLSSEINVALPIAINHARLQALCGHNLPIAMSQFLGTSGRVDGNFATTGSGNFLNITPTGSYYGATFQSNSVFWNNSSVQTSMLFNNMPAYTGNIFLKNNTTGVSLTLTFLSSSPAEWSANSSPANLLRAGGNDNFTIMAA